MSATAASLILERPGSRIGGVKSRLTGACSAQAVDAAVKALRFVSRYDSMRLETYRQKENLGKRICVLPIGSAMALRFDDVGYFNRVYCADGNCFDRLPEIEEFYRGSSFGCELVGPASDELGGVGVNNISRPGWAPAKRYAWLCHPDCNSLRLGDETTQFSIRPPKASERQQFLRAYLRAFDAQRDRIPAALDNMRHLFDRPELDFLMAWHGETLAGVAMMMRCGGGGALLCAGAVLPEFREAGCHLALLATRIRMASEAGCTQIYSWAAIGGQSQANLQKAGLEVVGTTSTWRYSPVNIL